MSDKIKLVHPDNPDGYVLICLPMDAGLGGSILMALGELGFVLRAYEFVADEEKP